MAYSAWQTGVPRGQKKNTQGLAFIIFNSYGTTTAIKVKSGKNSKLKPLTMPRLPGTGADMMNWIDALNKLKFDWRLERNGTKDDMERFIKSAQTTDMDRHSDYVLFVYSGHGSADSIVSQDNQDLPLKEFIAPLFQGTMASKTKLFFFDKCRSFRGEEPKDTAIESIVPPGEKKCFIFFATHLGGSAVDEAQGSFFSRIASEYILRPSWSVKEMGEALKTALAPHCDPKESPRFFSFDKGDDKTLSDDWKKLARPPAASDQPPPPPTDHIELYKNINVVNVLKRFGEGKFLDRISSVQFTVKEVQAMERMDVFKSNTTQKLIAKDRNGTYKSSHARRQLLTDYFCSPESGATTRQLVNFSIFVKSFFRKNQDLSTDIMSAIDSVSKEPSRPVKAVQTEELQPAAGQPNEKPKKEPK